MTNNSKMIFNEELKYLRSIIKKEDKFNDIINIIIKLHSLIHLSEMSNINLFTVEDELWSGLTENVMRNSLNSKGRTIIYGLWHSSRIEDITMNLLVANENQVLNNDNWIEKINSSIKDTGNAMTKKEILEFSKNININELKNYRIAVGRKSQEIIKKLNFEDLKRKFSNESLKKIITEGAVLNVKEANWLIDFWSKKDVSGIIFMPLTRHQLVHLNESFQAKSKKLLLASI